MMPNWSDYERYLKPIHLKGQPVTLTIVKAVEEETHPQKGKTVMSPVLYFRELPFGLILSPTNRQTLIALYGDRVADCVGKPITVQAVAMKVAGNDKQPIRIMKQRPAAPAIVPATGEIVEPASVTEQPSPMGNDLHLPQGEGRGEGGSELDKYLGPRVPDTTLQAGMIVDGWPLTEVAYGEWLKRKGWNGKETYEALRADAKTWLRKNPSLTWADVAMKVAEHMKGRSA